MSFFDPFMAPAMRVGGATSTPPVVVAAGQSRGDGSYFVWPPPKTQPPTKSKTIVLDPMNMSLRDVLRLLEQMRPRRMTSDEFREVLGPLLDEMEHKDRARVHSQLARLVARFKVDKKPPESDGELREALKPLAPKPSDDSETREEIRKMLRRYVS